MDMPDTDRLGNFAKRKVAESDARVNKSRSMTPTKKDPIVTMDAVKKAGFTNLRDYLNDKKGLKRRDGKAPERTKEYMAKNMIAPAVEANPMGDAARDRAIMTDEARKRKSAPRGAGPSDADVMRAKAMTAKAQEEKYGSGLKMGGKVKGYKVGGSPGMHRMPDGKMMKDSEHKGMMGGGKGYTPGGSTEKSPEMKKMPDNRPFPKDAAFDDKGVTARKSPYMVKLAGGGSVTRGDGIAKRGHTKGRLV